MKKLLAVAVLFASAAFAADVDGKWTGSMSTPNGDVPVNFTFMSDGAKLDGSTTGPGGEIKIADGKVDGNNISFSVTINFQDMPFTMNYKGVVAKDEIKFTIDIFGMPVELTVKRAS
jgi:opacity protein-like surface antigen